MAQRTSGAAVPASPAAPATPAAAPAAAAAATPAAAPPAKKTLPLLTKLLMILGMLVSASFAMLGAVGMVVLLDTEDKHWISDTEFGRQYRRLIQWNPFFNAFFFNGGLIGTFGFGTVVLGMERAARDPKPKRTPKAESKKTK